VEQYGWYANGTYPCECECSVNHGSPNICDDSSIVTHNNHAICVPCYNALFPRAFVRDLVEVLFA
jgi:hypothetical protein